MLPMSLKSSCSGRLSNSLRFSFRFLIHRSRMTLWSRPPSLTRLLIIKDDLDETLKLIQPEVWLGGLTIPSGFDGLPE